jgi:hypothetical protein
MGVCEEAENKSRNRTVYQGWSGSAYLDQTELFPLVLASVDVLHRLPIHDAFDVCFANDAITSAPFSKNEGSLPTEENAHEVKFSHAGVKWNETQTARPQSYRQPGNFRIAHVFKIRRPRLSSRVHFSKLCC